MKLIRAISRSCSTECLFWFCALWMVVMMIMTITQFLKLEVVLPVPFGMPISYFVLLIIYAARKEKDRWFKRIRRKKRGELFFWLWWILLLAMFIISSLTGEKYKVPPRALEICIDVSIVYFGSELSKFLYWRKLVTKSGPPTKREVSHVNRK